MGSWFSSPAAPRTIPAGVIAGFEELKRTAYALECEPRASDEAYCIRDLAYLALKHYNSNHPGAEFRFPAQPTTSTYFSFVYPPTKDMKGACVGFRGDLLYHINFLALRRTEEGDGERTFFAEICYDNSSHCLIVQTCTILEKPFRSSSCCALCPDETKILHPEDAEFVCGKEGHQREFFNQIYAQDGTKEFFSQRDMLRTPFLIGGQTPRYRLVDVPSILV